MRKFIIVLLVIAGLFYILVHIHSDDGGVSSSTSTVTPKKEMSFEEFINQDTQCDKPYDVVTKHGKAVAELCYLSKSSGFKPADYVHLELAIYKTSGGKVSAYTQELIDGRYPELRPWLQSREAPQGK